MLKFLSVSYLSSVPGIDADQWNREETLEESSMNDSHCFLGLKFNLYFPLLMAADSWSGSPGILLHHMYDHTSLQALLL